MTQIELDRPDVARLKKMQLLPRALCSSISIWTARRLLYRVALCVGYVGDLWIGELGRALREGPAALHADHGNRRALSD
jgi:hypothetical protein